MGLDSAIGGRLVRDFIKRVLVINNLALKEPIKNNRTEGELVINNIIADLAGLELHDGRHEKKYVMIWVLTSYLKLHLLDAYAFLCMRSYAGIYRLVLLFIVFTSFIIPSLAQNSNKKVLFIIDSIPFITNPEAWNSITPDDIADMNVVNNKDSLKLLGWERMERIIYIFTREYRKRPDSVKAIPSLRQMKMKDGEWNLHDMAYTGRYIDYYNDGRIQNKGALLYGKLHGELITYFRNGNQKSVSNYENGLAYGILRQYYRNGAVRETLQFEGGYVKKILESFFINGQPQRGIKLKGHTPYDTLIQYYSTGKVKGIKLIKNHTAVYNKKETDLNYYTTMFFPTLRSGKIAEANKIFFKIWKLDSASAQTYFLEGMLLAKESRFDLAIISFDKALHIEPLMREALVYRALARIKKFKFTSEKPGSKVPRESGLSLRDLISIVDSEREKICSDLQQADLVDFSEYYLYKLVPTEILNYCLKQNMH